MADDIWQHPSLQQGFFRASKHMGPDSVRHLGEHGHGVSITSTNSSLNSAHQGGHGDGRHGEQPVYRPPKLHYYLSRLFWILIILIVLIIGLSRLITFFSHGRRIKKKLCPKKTTQSGHTAVPTEDPDAPPAAPEYNPASPLNSSDTTLVDEPIVPKRYGPGIGMPGTFRIRAWNAAQRNWLYLRTFPAWLYGPETVADALWTFAYTLLMLAFTIASAISTPPGRNPWLTLANHLGVYAFAQVPLIIILIQKNNPISLITGITYQKLNYLHRASSRVALLFSWFHVLAWMIPVWEAGHFSHAYIIFGLIAIFGYTGLWVTSFRFVRRVAFEFFLVAHIIFTILFIGGAIIHWWRLAYWLYPSLVFWIGDRMWRLWTQWRINPPAALRWMGSKSAPEKSGQCTITLMSPEIMVISAIRPGLEWTPGQHFFLSSPSVSSSIHESHPFSVSNMPNERHEVIFIVRIHNGFTKQLRQRLIGKVTTEVPIYLEGPYGTSHSLASYSTAILVAGGTGITYLSSNLLGLLGPDVPEFPRHVHLIWHIRHSDDVVYLVEILNEAASWAMQYHPQTRLTVDIQVTKSHQSDEPAPALGFTDVLVEEFAPRRFSRQFSRSEAKPVISSDIVPRLSHDEEGPDGEAVIIEEDEVQDEREDRSSGENSVAQQHQLLPKKPILTAKIGLSSQAASVVSWKKGRADLVQALEDDLETTTGPIMLTVCGPIQLLHAAREAVKDVATPDRVLHGQWAIDFYEETLGS